MRSNEIRKAVNPKGTSKISKNTFFFYSPIRKMTLQEQFLPLDQNITLSKKGNNLNTLQAIY